MNLVVSKLGCKLYLSSVQTSNNSHECEGAIVGYHLSLLAHTTLTLEKYAEFSERSFVRLKLFFHVHSILN